MQMKMLIPLMLFPLALLALVVPSVAVAQDLAPFPQLEKVFVTDGEWRFSGPEANDQAPGLLEVNTDGEVRITLWNTTGVSPLTAVNVTGLSPSWGLEATVGRWPQPADIALGLGTDYRTVYGSRGFNLNGTAADSLSLELVSGTYAVVSAGDER